MRKILLTIIAVLVVFAIGLAAFIYSGSYYMGADKPHWSITSWLVDQMRDRSIAAQAAGITVPARLDDEAKVEAGAAFFAEHCVMCHGAPGVKRGDLAAGLYPKPPDLADAPRYYKENELFWIIKHGIKMSAMPSWNSHNDDELWAIVAFIKKLSKMKPEDYDKLVAAAGRAK